MRSNGRRGRGAGRDDMNRHPSGQASANPGAIHAADHAIIAALAGDPLGRLLAAAAAPAHPGELLGEEEAAAAFRSATTVPVLSIVRDRRSRRVTVAVATQAACAIVVAAAGAALAAGTGLLPNPFVDASTSLPVPPSATPFATVSTAGPSLDPPAVDQTVPMSLDGLCRAYQAHGGDSMSMGSEAFGALVAAAGGPDLIPEFCVDRLGEEPGRSGDEHGPPTAPPGHGDMRGRESDPAVHSGR
jgi:hypothetical protein